LLEDEYLVELCLHLDHPFVPLSVVHRFLELFSGC
jgi:hypothetical protein